MTDARMYAEAPKRDAEDIKVGETRTHVRSTDPDASAKAAKNVVLRANSQKAKLLAAFGSVDTPLINEEAADLAGINPRSCWWKRCSDLRADGLIEWFEIVPGTIYEKRSTANEWCGASVITDKGRAKLKELGLS